VALRVDRGSRPPVPLASDNVINILVFPNRVPAVKGIERRTIVSRGIRIMRGMILSHEAMRSSEPITNRA
jgi:hypothetical protein